MAKFYGKFGFSITVEVERGEWVEQIEEKEMYGDVIKSNYSQSDDTSINQGIQFNKTISVIFNDYLSKNLSHLRYVEYKGIKLNVKSVDDSQYPRLNLTLGGIYNG